MANIPLLQTLVVNKQTNLPSYGLRAFVPGYDNFPSSEQKSFVMEEHSKIEKFGKNWLLVLDYLGLKQKDVNNTNTDSKLYNPFGSEGSPEHINVKKYILTYHHLLGYTGTTGGIEEFPLRSGDKIDVVFKDNDTIYAYEAKSIRSNLEDIERGIFQCVKYKNILEAENKVGIRNVKKIICNLIIEGKLPSKLEKYCQTLGIKFYVVKVNKLDV